MSPEQTIAASIGLLTVGMVSLQIQVSVLQGQVRAERKRREDLEDRVAFLSGAPNRSGAAAGGGQ